jgi:hypothetical protein
MFQVSDIGGFLDALACAGKVDDAGHESIDPGGGKAAVATNHYRVDADAAKLKGCIARNQNAGQLLDNLGDAERATVDVWVDDRSLVRKLVVTADEKALGAGLAAQFKGGTSVLTMTLSGFGEPVTIEAPPEAEVSEGLGSGLGAGDATDLGGLIDLFGG